MQCYINVRFMPHQKTFTLEKYYLILFRARPRNIICFRLNEFMLCSAESGYEKFGVHKTSELMRLISILSNDIFSKWISSFFHLSSQSTLWKFLIIKHAKWLIPKESESAIFVKAFNIDSRNLDKDTVELNELVDIRKKITAVMFIPDQCFLRSTLS